MKTLTNSGDSLKSPPTDQMPSYKNLTIEDIQSINKRYNHLDRAIEMIPSWRGRHYTRRLIRDLNRKFSQIIIYSMVNLLPWRIRQKFFRPRPTPKERELEKFKYHNILITPSYPSLSGKYGGEFIHRRVINYQNSGLKIVVIKPSLHIKQTIVERLNGIDIISCQYSHLQKIINTLTPPHILIHFLNKQILQAIFPLIQKIPISIWIHGFEARHPKRLHFNFRKWELFKKSLLIKPQLKRMGNILKNPHIKKIFISNYLKKICEEDCATKATNYKIIPNYIDQSLFQFSQKRDESRKNIVLLRPFTAANYGGDIAIKAIKQISTKDWFHDLNINIYGFGYYFDDLTKTIESLPNVKVHKGYVKQEKIPDIYKEHGVALVPTRFDTQGVSMGEAMASGLIPISHNVAAIPEFLDESCGFLVEPEDHIGLAEAIEKIYYSPELFKEMSLKASERVIKQCGYKSTIAIEVDLIRSDS